MTDNDKDADAFCRQMEELKSTITNEALRKDFDHPHFKHAFSQGNA